MVKNLPATAEGARHRFDPWVENIPWSRKWQPTPVCLPGKSHAQRSLDGCSPQGCRVRHEWAHTHTHYTNGQTRGFISWSTYHYNIKWFLFLIFLGDLYILVYKKRLHFILCSSPKETDKEMKTQSKIILESHATSLHVFSGFFIDVFKRLRGEDQEEKQTCSDIHLSVLKNYLTFWRHFPPGFLTFFSRKWMTFILIHVLCSIPGQNS